MPDRSDQARALMSRFAERTGLTVPGPHPRRYLWTDAFAVTTYLGLGEEALALRLVDQVHHTLGRHRPDDRRTGWLSGDEAHPTRGGLRIGKPLPEREPGERIDERLEWDRDGQYFHYLTKWMHALDQAARWTGRAQLNAWARELAVSAHRAFTAGPRGGHRRMHWKMSIDLSRPLVPSMGQHDPLDGLVTAIELDATAVKLGETPWLNDLATDYASMVDPHALATDDPLGVGGLLFDAARVEQLVRAGALPDATLLEQLLTAAAVGLSHCVRRGELRRPAAMRLAFRELGLSIGLAAVERMGPTRFPHGEGARARLAHLAALAPLRDEIESFWLRPESQRAAPWLEHPDINDVMLAASLAPEGFLALRGL